MEMEDHHHHSTSNSTNNQYTIDLRHFISGRPSHFPPPPPPPPPLSVDIFSRNPHQPQLSYDMMMFMPRAGAGLHEFPSDSAALPPPLLPTGSANSGGASVAAACSTPSGVCAIDGDGGTGRWPRQETLTLLEIRSRLDSKFKEANQKGPLWDEVSRIMAEENGYQRSGKKCREKFENLYKYYKKTKEGKAGRQDGKHYRFFRQLEALYGDTSNPIPGIPESQFGGPSVRFHSGINTSIQAPQENFHSSLSLSNSSGFDTCSSEDNDHDLSTNDSTEKRRKGRSWKAKIKEFIDLQMRKLIEKQEAWLERLTKTLEQKEQERMIREEEWRNQEAARVEKEQKFWAKERAWIEARDAALMDTLRKLKASESSPENPIDNGSQSIDWDDNEITRLVQLRSSLESRFQQCGSIEEEECLWKELARKMGYENNPLICKEKWDSISNYNRKSKQIISSNKKRKENSNSLYYQSNYTYCDQGNQEAANTSTNQENPSVNENCFPFLMSDGGGENLWENYGLKLSKGN